MSHTHYSGTDTPWLSQASAPRRVVASLRAGGAGALQPTEQPITMADEETLNVALCEQRRGDLEERYRSGPTQHGDHAESARTLEESDSEEAKLALALVRRAAVPALGAETDPLPRGGGVAQIVPGWLSLEGATTSRKVRPWPCWAPVHRAYTNTQLESSSVASPYITAIQLKKVETGRWSAARKAGCKPFGTLGGCSRAKTGPGGTRN